MRPLPLSACLALLLATFLACAPAAPSPPATSAATAVAAATKPAATTQASPPPAASPAASPTAAPVAAKPAASPLPSPVAAASPSPSPEAYPLSLRDDQGRTVALAAAPQRIVTLQPSATEIVCAVGACSRVVATDDFSDFPEEVKGRPKLGSMSMSAEGVIGQRPDLVVTEALTRADLVEQLARTGIPILVTEPKTFDDVYRDIDLIARAVGSPQGGARVVADMRARVQAVTSKTTGISTRPRVFHELDGTDPNRPFAVGPGTFIDQIITLAGGTNALASSPVAYPQVSAEQVVAADPEIITLGDAAFGVLPESVAARAGWSGITAVKNKAIHGVDTNAISRPGPRLVDGLEEFARIIHPELFR